MEVCQPYEKEEENHKEIMCFNGLATDYKLDLSQGKLS